MIQFNKISRLICIFLFDRQAYDILESPSSWERWLAGQNLARTLGREVSVELDSGA